MNKRLPLVFLVLAATLLTGNLAAAAWSEQRERDARDTIEKFKNTNQRIASLFDRVYGYAVFPTIGKGGFAIGGAFGKGVVFEQGTAVGTTKVFQLSIGLQFGGQAYSEVVFFENKRTLDRFRTGDFKLGAHASAVAVTAGASVDATFHGGIAVFTLVKGGLMYEASVGGQKFTFTAREGAYVSASAKQPVAVSKPKKKATVPAKQPAIKKPAAKKPAARAPVSDGVSAKKRFEQARRAFSAGRYSEAHDLYLRAAGAGHVDSLYELGKMYGDGQGVLQDFVSAHAYFNVAAAKGHKQAVQARQILDDVMSNEERAAARKRASEYWETYGK